MARLAVIFLFVGAITPLITAQCNYRTATPFFRRSVYEFTLDLVRRINQETESHFIASALSPWTLISAISLGAADNTLNEIHDVLKLHPHKCFNNIFFNLAKQVTRQPNDLASIMLERSATIFFDDSLYVKPSFFEKVAEVGMCDAKLVSFSNPEVSAGIINRQVSRFTHEAIDEIVTPSDLEDMVIVMVDALYFKGVWQTPFPYEDTENSAFYNSRGQQIGDVSLMYVSAKFNITTMPQIQAKVLELPYSDDSRYSMLIFLPFKNVSVTTVFESMKKISISSVYILFGNYGPQSVDVQLPRFKISSDINNLKELLIDMGLQSLFDQNASNFPGITDYQMSLSNFIQKADIEVTEDGTVSSVATAALFESRMLPEQFEANRPFIFMIVDRQLQIPIFTGAYSKPSNF